jgi:hypothetical protein
VGAPPFTALRVLQLRNLTVHDRGWEAVCAVAAGPTFPCLTTILVDCLELEESHVNTPCGSLRTLKAARHSTRAIRRLLQPAVRVRKVVKKK